MQNILSSGIGKLQSPAQKCELKSSCGGFVYNKLYIQNCYHRKQAELPIYDIFLLKKEKNETQKPQCSVQINILFNYLLKWN